MVRSSTFLFGFLGTLFLIPRAFALEFKLEPSKTDFYQGENITANFVIYGKSDSVEVEVAKFPEFRSFWSENTILRQGPIPLFSGGTMDPFPRLPFEELIKRFRARKTNTERKATIGAYTITAMVGRTDLKILPMKIVARDPSTLSTGTVTLESTIPNLIIRRLPNPPPDLLPLFRGAVGAFRLNLETEEVRFRKGEPAVLRLLLSGDGNFPEINEIPLSFPPSVELLSSHSQMLQTGQESSKVYDYTLSVTDPSLQEIGPFTFAYFDPTQNKFKTLRTLPIRLLPASENASQENAISTLDIPLERSWTPSRSVLFSPIAIGVQGLLFVLLAFHMVWVHLEKLSRKKHIGAAYIRQQKLRLIEEAVVAGETEKASHDFAKVLEDLLESEVPVDQFLSRSQKLRLLESRHGLEVRQSIEKALFEREHSLYSPEKRSVPSVEIYLRKLKPFLKT